MQNVEAGRTAFSILHSAFCVLHSYEKGRQYRRPQSKQ
jgi:hypothetical protein